MNRMKWKSLHYYKKLKVLLLLILVYLRFVVYPFIFSKSFRVRKEIVRADFIICCSFLSTRLSTGYSTRLHKYGKGGKLTSIPLILRIYHTKTTNLIEKKLNRQTRSHPHSSCFLAVLVASQSKERKKQSVIVIASSTSGAFQYRKKYLICIVFGKAYEWSGVENKIPT